MPTFCLTTPNIFSPELVPLDKSQKDMSKETEAHIHLPANAKANPRKASAYKLRRGSLQEQNYLSRLSVGVSEQFANARNAFSRLPTPGSSNSGMQEPISKQMRRRIPKNHDNRSRRRETPIRNRGPKSTQE